LSLFKKLGDNIKKDIYYDRLPLINEFCEHLRQIGVNASVLEFGSPLSLADSSGGTGYVKLEGRNIDLADSFYGSVSGKSRSYHSEYYVRGNVEGLENRLKAEGKPVKKSFFSSETVDYKWNGEDLAQKLNADSELKSMLIKEELGGISIGSSFNHQYVWIQGEKHRDKAFPTHEAFEAYDKIAHHIRSIVNS